MRKTNIGKTRTLPERYKAGFVDRMDGREKITQELQQSFDEIVEDIGGADGQGHLKLALVERAVFLEFKLREWEKSMLAGTLKDDQISRWIQAVNSLNGLCKMLGFREVAKGDFLDALYQEPKTSNKPEKAPSTPENSEDEDDWFRDEEDEEEPEKRKGKTKKKGGSKK